PSSASSRPVPTLQTQIERRAAFRSRAGASRDKPSTSRAWRREVRSSHNASDTNALVEKPPAGDPPEPFWPEAGGAKSGTPEHTARCLRLHSVHAERQPSPDH